MSQVRNNGIEVPVPSDPYNPPADMAKMADTADVVRRVPTLAAQNALTGKKKGTTICRTDVTGQPLFTWSGDNDASGGWVAVSSQTDVGQGSSRAHVKGAEVLATTNEFSVGFVTFATPFPNMCTAITLTHSTGSLTGVTFRIITRNPNSVEFVAYKADGTGLGAAGLYVNYIAVGY